MDKPLSGSRLIGIAMVALLPVAMSACGSSSAPPDALAGKSAAEVLQLALQNATEAGTMSYRITTRGSGQQNVVGNTSARGGDVVVTSSAGVVHIIVTGGTAYIESTTPAGLVGALGVSAAVAAANAKKWISLAPKDTQFTQLSNAASFSSTMAEFTPGGTLSLSETTVAGHPVGLINGTGTSSVALQSYSVQLAVSTRTPVLPVAGAVSVQGNGKTATQVALFARWGKPVALNAPTNTTPLSALPRG
jgi:hypothetical protein